MPNNKFISFNSVLKRAKESEHLEIDSSDWHKDVLAERKDKIKKGTANFISLDELRAYRG